MFKGAYNAIAFFILHYRHGPTYFPYLGFKYEIKYILNHKYPPNFIGFIFNYPKSKRNLNLWELTKLLNLKKHHKINFVSVLVNPSDITLIRY